MVADAAACRGSCRLTLNLGFLIAIALLGLYWLWDRWTALGFETAWPG